MPAVASCRRDSLLTHVPKPGSATTHRVSARQDPLDQGCNGGVQICQIVLRRILVGRSRIEQNADDFLLGQDVAVVQRQQQRFTDGKGGGSGDITWHGHDRFHFRVSEETGRLGREMLERTPILCIVVLARLIQSSLHRLFSLSVQVRPIHGG